MALIEFRIKKKSFKIQDTAINLNQISKINQIWP